MAQRGVGGDVDFKLGDFPHSLVLRGANQSGL